MDDLNNYVYCHTNKINGKKYIGITNRKKPEYRWKNGAGYRENTAFYRAIKKYGWDGFEHEIMFSGLSREEACNKEKELIALYRCTEKEYGYNIGTGGENGATGSKRSEAHKKRMSEYMKKRMKDPETVEKLRKCRTGFKMNKEQLERLSKSHLGHSPSNKGIPMSEEQKAILKERKKSKMKAVYCITTGEYFESIREASIKMGLRSGNIQQVCAGKRKTVQGYQFMYANKEKLA